MGECRRLPLGQRLRAKLEAEERPQTASRPTADPKLLAPLVSAPVPASAAAALSVPPYSAAALLGADVAASLQPQCYTCDDEDAPASSLLPETSRERVRRLLLSDQTVMALARIPVNTTHEFRDGQIRLSRHHFSATFEHISKLGECADSRCGCYRLFRPDVRRHFRTIVARLTTAQLQGQPRAGVRYVTIGSGSALTDFEILCALHEAGLRIESVICIDTCYDDSGDNHATATGALQQLGAFFAPAAVYAFGSLSRFQDACAVAPELYGGATTFVHCDAGSISGEDARAAAALALVEGGHLFALANLGMGIAGASDNKGSGAHQGTDPLRADGNDARARHYWRAQLRHSHSIEAWRRKTDVSSAGLSRGARAQALLTQLPAEICNEPSDEKAARQERAKKWLAQSLRDRAAELGLDVYTVVFEGGAVNKDGKDVPAAIRNTVAVRAAPSRTASMVSTRHKGDEVLVAEERAGWVRLSEEDDDWGWQRQTGAQKEQEAWMLIDGKEAGLGRLLEKVVPV